MAIGVAAVVVLTALGEGARLYVVNQFSSLGTNLRDRVARAHRNRRRRCPACCSGRRRATSRWTTRSRSRAAAAVRRVAPLIVGAARRVAAARAAAKSPVLGSTARLAGDPPHGDGAGPLSAAGRPAHGRAGVRHRRHGRARTVRQRARRSASGCASATGASASSACSPRRASPWASTPTRSSSCRWPSAQSLFNTDGAVPHPGRGQEPRQRSSTSRTTSRNHPAARHEGEHDVTVITQDAVLATFDRILARADPGGGRHRRHQPGRGRHPDHERDADRGGAAHARRSACSRRWVRRARQIRACSSPKRVAVSRSGGAGRRSRCVGYGIGQHAHRPDLPGIPVSRRRCGR